MMTSFSFLLCLGFLSGVSSYASISQNATFQWQLSGSLDSSVDAEVYDIDLFDNTAATIASLKASGKIVICYFSAGTYEDWRSDVGSVPSSLLGKALPEWAGEKWWAVNDPIIRDIMIGRLNLAVQKGCDGVEPDNVDGFTNDNGLGLTEGQLTAFVMWLSHRAHDRDLSIGLKNALDLINCTETNFDWALNEQCFEYSECDRYGQFLNNGKAVFHTEYVDDIADGPAKQTAVCGNVPSGFTTIIKEWDLSAWILTC